MTFLIEISVMLFAISYGLLSVGQLFILDWVKLKNEDMQYSIIWPNYRKKYMQKYIDPSWVRFFCYLDWVRLTSFSLALTLLVTRLIVSIFIGPA
jgi:hypothetical protein